MNIKRIFTLFFRGLDLILAMLAILALIFFLSLYLCNIRKPIRLSEQPPYLVWNIPWDIPKDEFLKKSGIQIDSSGRVSGEDHYSFNEYFVEGFRLGFDDETSYESFLVSLPNYLWLTMDEAVVKVSEVVKDFQSRYADPIYMPMVVGTWSTTNEYMRLPFDFPLHEDGRFDADVLATVLAQNQNSVTNFSVFFSNMELYIAISSYPDNEYNVFCSLILYSPSSSEFQTESNKDLYPTLGSYTEYLKALPEPVSTPVPDAESL